jgi:hypothetical protein
LPAIMNVAPLSIEQKLPTMNRSPPVS